MNLRVVRLLAVCGWPLLVSCARQSVDAPPAGPASDSPVTVGPNVMVSSPDSGVAEFEALAAADPANPKNLMACTMAMDPERNAHLTLIYTSFDGGATWERTFTSDRSSFVGDPTCVYGFGDTAYAANLPIYIRPDNKGEIAVLRSVDRGKTWAVVHSRPFIDREYLTLDRTSGLRRGHLYLHAQALRTTKAGRTGTELQLLTSKDGGVTFSDPVAPANLDRYGAMTPGTGVVLDDGTLVIPFLPDRDGKDYVEVTWSNDGGATLSAPVVVAQRTECSQPGIAVDLAVDESKGPFHGRLYAVYGDQDGGRCRIKLAHSTDGGRNWSKPVVVSDDRPRATSAKGPDNFMPSLAVNSNGVVGVSWYDRRESEDNSGFSLRFAASLDGGQSFLPSAVVSSEPARFGPNDALHINAFAGGGRSRSTSRRGGALWSMFYPEGYRSPGDTREMVAAGDAFYPFWYDNRTGVSKLYTAKVGVDGAAVPNGSPDLAELTDVSELVTVDYTRSRFDPATHTYSVAATLVNLSDTAIVAPVKMRVTGIWSAAGAPRITNAANRKAAVGAIWDFTSAVEGGVLKPGASAAPVLLEFRFDGFRAVGDRDGAVSFNESMFLWLEARVVAQLGASTK